MLDKLVFFKKAKPDPVTERAKGDEEQMQGSYTDHHMSPYQLRMALDPMHGDELQAFNWILDKLDKEYPKSRLSDLVEYGLDDEWFLIDKKGMLRVNPDAPGVENADE